MIAAPDRRKPQAKKHKTWDNDGILVVTGGQAELKDKENANKCARDRKLRL